jgi:DNA-binding beta-propeller fold protein YncE
MKRPAFAALLLYAVATLAFTSGYTVRTVDFLSNLHLSVNGAGPLLVKADPDRNRVILVHTLTSSVSIIDGATHQVANIPLSGRVPQYFKAEALTLNRRLGTVFVLGNHCLHVVDPGRASAKTIPTTEQYESVAVEESSGLAVLAGRESRFLAVVDAAAGTVDRIPWTDWVEAAVNLNATPPPPFRKVVADAGLGRVFAVDGRTATLFEVDPNTRRILRQRPLALSAGGRWHLAGYNESAHALYLVTETVARVVVEAGRIDVTGGNDRIVRLPGLTEGVGITASAPRDELYIAYDNEPTVHVVDFKNDGALTEVALPAFGNDSAVVDETGGKLYIASWSRGEIDVVDLAKRKLDRRIEHLGIVPHMFSMAWNAANRRLYIPLGATAVNGSWGAALTELDPSSGETEKIRTGWAPVDLIQRPGHDSFLVFNSEDRMAEVSPDGTQQSRPLPRTYPLHAGPAPDGRVYLAYGHHQSYWPVVYIWGSRDGLLGLDPETWTWYDRRLPRQAHDMALDSAGRVYLLQNNWGKEEQFIAVLEDGVREWTPERRIRLGDELDRETTQRILRYDPELERLYIVRIAETDDQPGVFQAVDLRTRRVLHRALVGRTPTDLVVTAEAIFVANFDSDTVTRISRRDFVRREIAVGHQPLKLAAAGDRVLVLHHGERTLGAIDADGSFSRCDVPGEGRLDNLSVCGDTAFLTSHAPDAGEILAMPATGGTVTPVHRFAYPFGETGFDSRNTAFFMPGQFGDALFEITRLRTDSAGRVWITDFLSGRLFILQPER